jgi:hypothetical protein
MMERRIVHYSAEVYAPPWAWTSVETSGRSDHTLAQRWCLYSQVYAPVLVLLLLVFVTYVFFAYLMLPLFLGRPLSSSSCSPGEVLIVMRCGSALWAGSAS